MTAVDVGCAMGFFSLPMAELVGPEGRVICIDLQEKMVQKLYRRAKKKNLLGSIEARVCMCDCLNVDDLEKAADFVLAAAVIHEVPDAASFLAELFQIVKEDGKLLVVEPGGHVSEQAFKATIEAAVKCGFTLLENSGTRRRHRAHICCIPNAFAGYGKKPVFCCILGHAVKGDNGGYAGTRH